MDNKINISIDIDGTINSTNTAISFFRIMTHLLQPDSDINITILTNREPGTEAQIAKELARMNISYDDIVITSKKAEYIKNNDISVVFENEDEIFQHLGADILVFKVRETGNYNYMSGRWYGSADTVEMVDQ